MEDFIGSYNANYTNSNGKITVLHEMFRRSGQQVCFFKLFFCRENDFSFINPMWLVNIICIIRYTLSSN